MNELFKCKILAEVLSLWRLMQLRAVYNLQNSILHSSHFGKSQGSSELGPSSTR